MAGAGSANPLTINIISAKRKDNMKPNRLLFKLIPEGSFKESIRSLYYKYYYNRKHFKENNFYVYRKKEYFEYKFPDGISFKCYSDVGHELRTSLRGYIKEHKIKPGDVIIDCGSGEGDFTLYAAKSAGPSGKVAAFEPDPAIYEELKSNVALNGLDNVVLINKGLWNKDTSLKFMTKKKVTRSIVFNDEAGEAIDIPVVALDTELMGLGIHKVDFIKMDVEGAELETVMGARRTLAGNRADLAIASYHILDGKKSCYKLEKMLSEMGYEAHTSYPAHLTTYASKAHS